MTLLCMVLQAAFEECKADSENVKHILRALVPVSGQYSVALFELLITSFDSSPQQKREAQPAHLATHAGE